MQNDRIYYRELQCYKAADRKNTGPKESSGCYDLSLLPEGQIREEMKSFIFQEGERYLIPLFSVIKRISISSHCL